MHRVFGFVEWSVSMEQTRTYVFLLHSTKSALLRKITNKPTGAQNGWSTNRII